MKGIKESFNFSEYLEALRTGKTILGPSLFLKLGKFGNNKIGASTADIFKKDTAHITMKNASIMEWINTTLGGKFMFRGGFKIGTSILGYESFKLTGKYVYSKYVKDCISFFAENASYDVYLTLSLKNYYTSYFPKPGGAVKLFSDIAEYQLKLDYEKYKQTYKDVRMMLVSPDLRLMLLVFDDPNTADSKHRYYDTTLEFTFTGVDAYTEKEKETIDHTFFTNLEQLKKDVKKKKKEIYQMIDSENQGVVLYRKLHRLPMFPILDLANIYTNDNDSSQYVIYCYEDWKDTKRYTCANKIASFINGIARKKYAYNGAYLCNKKEVFNSELNKYDNIKYFFYTTKSYSDNQNVGYILIFSAVYNRYYVMAGHTEFITSLISQLWLLNKHIDNSNFLKAR